MKKIDMICIDLDGTLVEHSSSNVSQENQDAMAQAREKGVQVVINTGRAFDFCKTLAKNINFEGDLITGCGSRTYKMPEQETIIKSVMTYDDAKNYIRHTTEKGIIILVCSGDNAYISSSDLEKLRAFEGHWHQFFPFENVVESYEELIDRFPEDIDKVEGFATPDVLDELTSWIDANLPDTTSARTGSQVLEIFNKKAGKGSAMELLAESLGIKPENIMAIGDSGNDLHMFEAAGLSVAMGNSPQYIKDKCDYVTGSFDENGVAQAIKKFVLDN